MLLNKIKENIRIAILIHKELGVNYFQLLREYLKKDGIVTVNIENLSFDIDVARAIAYANIFKNIRKHGWKITNVVNNLTIFENKQKSIRLRTVTDDALEYGVMIEEVFIREVYKADFKNKVVIDVGAYRGESAIYFAINGAKKVVGLEPDEDNYKLALLNIKENDLENKIVLLNKALAPTEGVINFYKYFRLTNANSIDPNNMVKLNDQIIIKQVETITLNQLIKMVGERIGLLKLDCEGCEYSVLNSFSDFDMIDNIILEYHNDVQNLPSLLKSHGFEVTIEKANEKIGIMKAFKK